MGNYVDFDFSDEFNALIFQSSISRDQFENLTSFPGSDKMNIGQFYKWIVNDTAIVKRAISSDGANVMTFVSVTD